MADVHDQMRLLYTIQGRFKSRNLAKERLLVGAPEVCQDVFQYWPLVNFRIAVIYYSSPANCADDFF